MDRRVDFFIVGAAKSGTTSVFRYLSTHPGLFLPADKEPHFFGDQRPRAQYGKYPWYENYFALFEQARPEQLMGEGSAGYLYSETAAREIHRYNPSAKIIILLRDPRDRAYSLFWHHIRDFTEPRQMEFEDALDLEEERIGKKYPYSFHYLSSGLYADQVARYLNQFGADQVRIMLMEEMIADPKAAMSSLCDFLGVESAPLETGRVHNRSGAHKSRFIAHWFARPNRLRRIAKKVLPRQAASWRERIVQRNLVKAEPMKPETRARLTEFFRGDVAKLEQLIGRELSRWTA